MHRGYGLLACSVLFLWSARVSAQVSAEVGAEAAPAPSVAAQSTLAPAASAPPPSAASVPPAAAAEPTPPHAPPPWRRASGESSAAGSGETGPGAGHNLRAQNTWFGSTGGLHLIDGGSGEVGTLRLHVGFDYFRASDLLTTGDTDEALSGVLSFSTTPIEQLEVFAALSSRSNSNSKGNPVLLQVAGDLLLGAKGYKQLLPWFSVGADARLMFLNTVGDLGIAFASTSLGLRGAATGDLRYFEKPVPLIIRANIGYLLDNSSSLIEDVEKARYAALPAATRRDLASEDRHLVTRIERFGLGINRVDMLSFGLGFEAPLTVATDFFVHPLLEWQIGIPVNRQGYSCLSVPTNASVNSPADGCLAITGLSAAPSTLTLGARVLPPVRGVSALLAFDIGVSGTSTFVRELASNRPWALMISLGYAMDTRAPKPEVHYVVSHAPAKPGQAASDKKRIHGQVLERGFGTPIAGAVVRYADRDLNPQLTLADGHFISYELDPGEIVLEVSHPDYETARCAATIPAPAAAPKPGSSGLVPAAAVAPAAPAAASGGAAPKTADFVEARCELVGKPKAGGVQGSVTNEGGMPLGNITIDITGPANATVVSDAGGQFSAQGLAVGEYTARVDSPNYLLKSQAFTLAPGADTTLQLSLVAKPKTAQVTMTASEVKIRTQIMFKSNSAEIDSRSNGLLTEIADVLQRNPQATHVQVQGHTDNRGDSAQNLALSQQRAEAVVQWLVNAGVDAGRLEAKGYGDARPIVPNLTPDSRSRNRRVQFMIKNK